ncbi:MAG: alpha/beta hydrolase family protein [bacterium]
MGGPTSEWNNAVVEGLEAINSALKFLKGQPYIDSERIGIIGFSEGGNITLWSALEQQDFIPLMKKLNKEIEYKTDYPGNHK